jgi:hypothetical protein
LTTWRSELEKTETSPKKRLNLAKLKMIEIPDCRRIVEFLITHLPQNTLTKVITLRPALNTADFKRFLDKQQTILDDTVAQYISS